LDTHRTTKLISLAAWLWCTECIREEVIGIKNIIPKEFINAAVDGVRS
jgi:hypothetical protein